MDSVIEHYGRESLGERILEALRRSGKDLDHLVAEDLVAVDAFHIRGYEATAELARRARFACDLRVLDVGCGVGGSSRYLAAVFGCDVIGVDLTPEYVSVARMLSERVGLAGRTTFQEGSALELPFDDESFDAVWTQHAQMNIPHKERFYAEIARVLRQGGKLAFHDVFAGDVAPAHFPVPWAGTLSLSALARPDDVRSLLESLSLEVLDWEDQSASSLEWLRAAGERLRASGPSPLGLHVVMGEDAPQKFGNMVRNLEERRIAVFQAVLVKK